VQSNDPLAGWLAFCLELLLLLLNIWGASRRIGFFALHKILLFQQYDASGVLAWLLPTVVRTFGNVGKCEFDVWAFQLKPSGLLLLDYFFVSTVWVLLR
jgi:hypothetical protein